MEREGVGAGLLAGSHAGIGGSELDGMTDRWETRGALDKTECSESIVNVCSPILSVARR